MTEVLKYTVNEIICFNNAMRVSSSHPVMTAERCDSGLYVSKWKSAFNVTVGDYVVGINGKPLLVTSRNRYGYDDGIEVLNLSTDSGTPFAVGNCVVRADNAVDSIEWANAPVTQKIWSAA